MGFCWLACHVCYIKEFIVTGILLVGAPCVLHERVHSDWDSAGWRAMCVTLKSSL